MTGFGGGSDPRVETIYDAYNRGMRSESLSTDTSPWVRAGLDAIEHGMEVTSDTIREADKNQTMRSPERK
jgi:hypothetical protein